MTLLQLSFLRLREVSGCFVQGFYIFYHVLRELRL
jgi:hypothetical protein